MVTWVKEVPEVASRWAVVYEYHDEAIYDIKIVDSEQEAERVCLEYGSLNNEYWKSSIGAEHQNLFHESKEEGLKKAWDGGNEEMIGYIEIPTGIDAEHVVDYISEQAPYIYFGEHIDEIDSMLLGKQRKKLHSN